MFVTFNTSKGFSSFRKPVSIRRAHHKHEKKWLVEVRVKGAILFSILALLVCYFVATIGFYASLAVRDHNKVTYTNVLLYPVDRDDYRRNQGRTLVAQGIDYNMQFGEILQSLKENPREINAPERALLHEAVAHLIAGLRLVPDDLNARQELASIYFMQRKFEDLVAILLDGLQYGFPEDKHYIALMLKVAQSRGNYEAMSKALKKLLQFPELQEDPDAYAAFLKQLIKTQRSNRDYLGMLETAQLSLKDESLPFRAYDAIILANYRLERYGDALDAYEATPEALRSRPRILLLKAMTHAELGQRKEMVAAIQKMYAANFQIEASHLESVILLMQQQEHDIADTYLERFIKRSIRDHQMLINMSAALADYPSSEQLLKVRVAASAVFPELTAQFDFLLAQAYFTEGNWEQARAFFEPISEQLNENAESTEVVQAFIDLLEMVEEQGRGTKEALFEQYTKTRMLEELYWEAAEALRKLGDKEMAVNFLNAGLNHYPFSNNIVKLRREILGTSERANSTASARDKNTSLDAIILGDTLTD